MGFKLFGKNKETVVNGAVKLVGDIRGMIDDKNFTPEERSRYYTQLADATAEYAKATLSENTARSIARRSIAVGSIYFFYGLILILILLWKLDNEWFIATKDLIVEFKLPVAFLMIMAFFFGGYYLKGAIPQRNKEDKKK